MNWLFAIFATITSYTLFSIFGMRTGNLSTLKQTLLAPVSNPIDFSLVMFGSIGFGVATYYALKVSPFAIPSVISLGLIVSFIFSVAFTQGEINSYKLLGLGAIIIGVWLLK